MPQHTRRPPAPPAPEFYIADPQPPRATDASPEVPAAPGEPAPVRERQLREPVRDERAGGWHQSEPWAVAMLVSFALMLVAVYVPGTVRLVLIGLSALAALAGIVMLVRRGLFDEPTTDE